jgi:hypothetical protein
MAEWLELALELGPLMVQAVETAFEGKSVNGQTKQGVAAHLLDTLLPGAPAAAAPNRAAEAVNLFAPIIDAAVAAAKQKKPAVPDGQVPTA